MKSCSKVKAFTLIELLVSISILSLVAAISVSSYPQFAEQIGVSAESYKVLAYMREAQVYGSSGYTRPGVKVVYGLEIDRDATPNKIKTVKWEDPTSTTNAKYIEKAESDNASTTIGSRYEISKMCSIVGTKNSCVDQNDGNYNQVYVFLKRPNPEARLIGMAGENMDPGPNRYIGLQKIEVHIQSKLNPQFVKKIVILQTGQMYVE